MCAHTFITFKPGNLPGTNSVFFCKSILGNTFCLHGIPQIVIYDQICTPFYLHDNQYWYIFIATDIGIYMRRSNYECHKCKEAGDKIFMRKKCSDFLYIAERSLENA